MGGIAARIDELGKAGWIGLMVVSFILWWPLGLLVLTYMIWSGRMTCWSHRGGSRLEEKFERMQQRAKRWYGASQSSGNAAFDEYRDETLRRLEEEEREFRAFLDRLRKAKDKAEFDQFMADRRNTPPAPQA